MKNAGGSGGGNEGGGAPVASVNPVSAKAVGGRPNPSVSCAGVIGGGPLGGGCGEPFAGGRGRDLLTPPVGGGGPVGPGGVVNLLFAKEIALGGGGGARSDGIRGPAKR